MILVLLLLIFSKYFYLASLTSYYTFYLIKHFGVSVQSSQLMLFVFLGSVALGTVIEGLKSRFEHHRQFTFSLSEGGVCLDS